MFYPYRVGLLARTKPRVRSRWSRPWAIPCNPSGVQRLRDHQKFAQRANIFGVSRTEHNLEEIVCRAATFRVSHPQKKVIRLSTGRSDDAWFPLFFPCIPYYSLQKCSPAAQIFGSHLRGSGSPRVAGRCWGMSLRVAERTFDGMGSLVVLSRKRPHAKARSREGFYKSFFFFFAAPRLRVRFVYSSEDP